MRRCAGKNEAARCLLAVLFFVAAGCASRSDEREVDPRGAVLLGQAQQANQQGAYREAIQFVDSAAQFIPDVPALWFTRGLVLSTLYRFDESDAAFERVLSLDPTYRSARFNMGHNAFLQSSFFAKDAFRTALRNYQTEETLLREALLGGTARSGDREGLVTVLLQIGTTYARLHVADSAALAYKEAIEVDSLAARGYAWLAALEMEAGELENALTNSRRAVEIDPLNVEHRLLLGSLLNDLGQYEAAVPHLDEAAQSEPWNRAAVYNLGRALVGSGRTEEGQTYLSRADTLEILREQIDQNHLRIFQDPNDPVRWENYAYLLHNAGQDHEARRAIAVMRYLEQNNPMSK